MELQDVLKSKMMSVLLVLVFGAVAVVTVELYLQKKQVDAEVARLQEQSSNLNRDNQQLSELVKYLDTPEYKEREAREKLNLKKEGEQVVVLPSDEELEALANAAPTDHRPNPEKWFAYFFEAK